MKNLHGSRKANITTGALRVYIANLGAYTEGRLEGAWLDLPATPEAIQEAFMEAGIDGIRYEEYAIHDFENTTGIEMNISEYASISRLNEMAEALEGLDEWELEQVKAYVNVTGYDVWDVIDSRSFENAIYVNVDLNASFNEERELAYAVVDELYGGIENLSQDTLEFHFDWDHFGRELGWDFDLITEDMDAEDRESLADMTNEEFAEWYVDGIGGLDQLGRATLESYFDYEAYGYDLQCQGWAVDRETGLAVAE